MKKLLTILTTVTMATTIVSCKKDKDVNVTDVTLSKNTFELLIGEEFTLTATVLPDNATNKNLTWLSSDPNVATVINGTVTAVSGGLTNIIVTTNDKNRTDTCVVMVSWNTEMFGVANFATTQTWTIGSQTWSDAVQTSFCSNKTTFNGGVIDWGASVFTFNIDCRSNSDHKGDLFSWRAVSELKNELCPAPWRVPTMQDFINLDIALGGTGNKSLNDVLAKRYRNDWGGDLGGYCSDLGWQYNRNSYAHYWSQSESDVYVENGFGLVFSAGNEIYPRFEGLKFSGQSLRCVRDK